LASFFLSFKDAEEQASSCLVLSYTRRKLGERSALGGGPVLPHRPPQYMLRRALASPRVGARITRVRFSTKSNYLSHFLSHLTLPLTYTHHSLNPPPTHSLTHSLTHFEVSTRPLSCTRLLLCERPPLGGAAALLARCRPPTALSKLGPAVRCRSSPEFPFRLIWVLGWSTRYLCANDPTPCACNTNCLRVLVLFNILGQKAHLKTMAYLKIKKQLRLGCFYVQNQSGLFPSAFARERAGVLFIGYSPFATTRKSAHYTKRHTCPPKDGRFDPTPPTSIDSS
jgi:hypothetical protein